MFTPGKTLEITVIEGGSESTYPNSKVLDYADGLLKIRDGTGKETVYNVRSLNFVKASEQK